MSNMAKQKGKRGEVEFAEILGSLLGVTEYEKNISPWLQIFVDPQAHGGDIVSIPGLAIEVKRQEVLLVDKWWVQACVQADRIGSIPVLAYRQNRRPWKVCLPSMLLGIGIEGKVEMDLGTFSQWLLHYHRSRPITEKEVGD